MVSEPIRKGFQEMKATGFKLSIEQLKTMMKAAGCEPLSKGLSDTNFTNFRRQCERPQPQSGDINLTPENEKVFRKFFYETSLGRSLRIPNPSVCIGQSSVADALSTPVPDGRQWAGLWFVIHASYRKKDNYAIHLMKVTYSGDEQLDVVDRTIDKFSGTHPELKSTGVMTIYHHLPHILTYGNERRIGFSLFVGFKEDKMPKYETKTINVIRSIKGILSGMDDDFRSFTRKTMLLKLVDAPANGEDVSYRRSEKHLYSLTGARELKDFIELRKKYDELEVACQGFRALNDWDDRGELHDALKAKRKLGF